MRDPNETLQRIRDLINNGEQPTNDDDWELHGLIRSLDNRLSRGGSLPDAWVLREWDK